MKSFFFNNFLWKENSKIVLLTKIKIKWLPLVYISIVKGFPYSYDTFLQFWKSLSYYSLWLRSFHECDYMNGLVFNTGVIYQNVYPAISYLVLYILLETFCFCKNIKTKDQFATNETRKRWDWKNKQILKVNKKKKFLIKK